MFSFELGAILSSQRQSRRPIEVVLRGGHNYRLKVGSVGIDWFSGLQGGRPSREFVITFEALTFVGGSISEGEQEYAPRSRVPLLAMLAHLERQHTLLTVHLREMSLVGRVTRVGRDCMGVTRSDGINVVIPLGQLLWIEACG